MRTSIRNLRTVLQELSDPNLSFDLELLSLLWKVYSVPQKAHKFEDLQSFFEDKFKYLPSRFHWQELTHVIRNFMSLSNCEDPEFKAPSIAQPGLHYFLYFLNFDNLQAFYAREMVVDSYIDPDTQEKLFEKQEQVRKLKEKNIEKTGFRVFAEDYFLFRF